MRAADTPMTSTTTTTTTTNAIKPMTIARRLALLPLFALLLCPGPGPGPRGAMAMVMATAEDEPPGPGPAGQATVPFEMLQTNHMVVRATINGKGPFHLIFDLGAPITLLGSRAGEKSGVIAANAPRSILFSIRGEGAIDTLQVGDLTARDVPAIVLDHPVLKALGDLLQRPLDGIIGYTFFARYRTTIDYQARTLTFAPVDFRVRNLIRDLPDRLAGPKIARQVVLAPGGLWGMSVGAAAVEGGQDVARLEPRRVGGESGRTSRIGTPGASKPTAAGPTLIPQRPPGARTTCRAILGPASRSGRSRTRLRTWKSTGSKTNVFAW